MISQVGVIGKARENEVVQASIKYRLNRNPVIGDKFSSRHGQKGVLSQLWPDVDMPYCALTGMRCVNCNRWYLSLDLLARKPLFTSPHSNVHMRCRSCLGCIV